MMGGPISDTNAEFFEALVAVGTTLSVEDLAWRTSRFRT